MLSLLDQIKLLLALLRADVLNYTHERELFIKELEKLKKENQELKDKLK